MYQTILRDENFKIAALFPLLKYNTPFFNTVPNYHEKFLLLSFPVGGEGGQFVFPAPILVL